MIEEKFALGVEVSARESVAEFFWFLKRVVNI